MDKKKHIESYRISDDEDRILPGKHDKSINQYEFKSDINIGKMIRNFGILLPHSYQIIIKNLMNPNTDINRIYMKWDTGTGKTIGSLVAAMEFIKFYSMGAKAGNPDYGSVIVIGFNQDIFKKELLSHPEFGYISHKELAELKQLQLNSSKGITFDIEKYNELFTKYKKRLSNRKQQGFFRFYGYKELTNRLFTLQSGESVLDDINALSATELEEKLRSGELHVNTATLDIFKNSLIICDEIHNVYNSIENNNWGITLKIILMKVPELRAIFLTATPLNYSPTEIVDLINLINPEQIKRSDLFDKSNNLKPNAINVIKSKLHGRVSFLRDADPNYFPSRHIIGDSIPGLPYLKFIRCKMSKKHYEIYKHAITQDNTINQESQFLMDIYFPVPPDTDETKIHAITSAIQNADIEWKEKYKIDVTHNGIITGDFLLKSNLKEYSSKYYEMVEDLHYKLLNRRGKIAIYHTNVHSSGVLFIREILLRNGVIDEHSVANDDTLCVYCGLARSKHKESQIESTIGGDADLQKRIRREEESYLKNPSKPVDKNHTYRPTRMIIIHSDIDNTSINRSITRFNRPSNSYGEEIMILIGSKKIKESYDFKAIRNNSIMRRTNDIPTLIQVLGRSNRKNSHNELPPDLRHVFVKLFVCSVPDLSSLSYEENKYKIKLHYYKIIQNIEKAIHESAIDAWANEPKITKNMDSKYSLGHLPFVIKKPTGKSTDGEFMAHYKITELAQISFLIKRLFVEISPIYNYKDLWSAVQYPPSYWETQQNPNTFSETIFKVALSKLLWDPDDYYGYIDENENPLHSLVDINSRIIEVPGSPPTVIMHIGEYYMRLVLENARTSTQQPLIDVDSLNGFKAHSVSRKIDINNLMSYRSIKNTYADKLSLFISQYVNSDLSEMSHAMCDYGTEFHEILIKDCIETAFQILKSGETPNATQQFYYKMLAYYGMLDIIIWADSVKSEYYSWYTKYVTAKTIPKSHTNDIRILQHTINTSGCSWCPNDVFDNYNRLIENLLKSKKITQPSMLPVGYYMTEPPKLYNPEMGWEDVPEYSKTHITNYIENDLIIGYDEKTESGVNVRFKIRRPVQQIELYKDSRKIERGSVCISKPKNQLIELIRTLGVTFNKKANVIDLCNIIRKKLIQNEISERKAGTNIKWFYHYFDKSRPD